MSSKFEQVSSAMFSYAISAAFLVVIGSLGWESWAWVWRMSALFALFRVADVFYERWRAGNSKAAVALRARAEARKAARSR